MNTEWTWRGILIHNIKVSLKAIVLRVAVIFLALLYGFLGFGFFYVKGGLTTWKELITITFIGG